MRRRVSAREGMTVFLGVCTFLAAFASCNLDDSNPPLKNEAPNLEHPSISIGAGPGTGGFGAGLGAGGGTATFTVTTFGAGGFAPAPNECECNAARFDTPNCGQCVNLSNGGNCALVFDACDQDISNNCQSDLAAVNACNGDPTCLDAQLPTVDGLLAQYFNCVCSDCAAECAHSPLTCN